MSTGPKPGEVWDTTHGVKLRPPTTSKPYYRLDYVLGGRRYQPSAGRDWRKAWDAACRADLLMASEAGDLGMQPVGALIDAWIAAHTPTWSPRYFELVQSHESRFIRPVLGDVACADLKRADVRDLLRLQTKDDRKKGIVRPESESVLAQTRTITSSLLRWGANHDWLDPTKPLFPSKEKEARVVQLVTMDQTPERTDVLNLVAQLGDPLALMVLVGAFMGLRQGEVFGALGSQVDGSVFHVVRQAQEVTGRGQLITPPKYKRTRDVHIPKMAGGFPVRQMLAEAAEKAGPDGVLFPAVKGGRWRKGTFRVAVAEPRKLAGFRWTFHALRHHYCRALLGAGVQAADVSLMAGHRSVNTTLDLYVNPSASAMDRMEAVEL